jgi:UPF0042 nucleotide-binding protein
VYSFSWKKGPPPPANLVLDVRFLRNPYYDETLRPFDGREARVAAYIAADPQWPLFREALFTLLPLILSTHDTFTIAVGCTGGQHRSVFVAEAVAAFLSSRGGLARVEHREQQQASL